MYRHNKTHTRTHINKWKRVPSRDGLTEMEWDRTNEPICICYLFHCASFCSSYAILLMRWHGVSEICAQKKTNFFPVEPTESRERREKKRWTRDDDVVVDVPLTMCQRSFCCAWYYCHRYTHIHVCQFSSIPCVRISQPFYNANAFNWSRK